MEIRVSDHHAICKNAYWLDRFTVHLTCDNFAFPFEVEKIPWSSFLFIRLI